MFVADCVEIGREAHVARGLLFQKEGSGRGFHCLMRLSLRASASQLFAQRTSRSACSQSTISWPFSHPRDRYRSNARRATASSVTAAGAAGHLLVHQRVVQTSPETIDPFARTIADQRPHAVRWRLPGRAARCSPASRRPRTKPSPCEGIDTCASSLPMADAALLQRRAFDNRRLRPVQHRTVSTGQVASRMT